MKIKVVKSAFLYVILLVFLSACSQNDEITYQLNTRLVELNCNRTLALEVTPALPGLSYTSLNTNIATVSAEGLVKAKLVGTTNVVVKDSLNRFVDTVKVVVRSVNKLFEDPYFGFGANSESVLKALNLTDFRYGYPSRGFALNLTVNGYRWFYCFSSDDKYLYSIYDVQESDYMMLDSHLEDRYLFIKTKQYTTYHTDFIDSYYISPDSTLIVMVEKDNINRSKKFVEFHPVTREGLQSILSDEKGDKLQDILHILE